MIDSDTPAVEVSALSKNYGAVTALNGVDVAIAPGEYFVLLGPSGGGKTTLLRAIGGFIRPSGGTIRLHGFNVSELPPDKRPTSMVFQSYALFPHMTVARNVGYGLRIKKLGSAEIAKQVEAMLDLVGLPGYGGRMPHELSGGQQQRVQLARSLILDRDILLLDEPLAALDANLRKDMCLELKHLQEKVGITFIHVTHNQEEAMTVADRIALIADGRLVEEGTARDIYEKPLKQFTAEFVGERNLFRGTIRGADNSVASLNLGYDEVDVQTHGQSAAAGAQASVSIRSELLELLPATGELPAGIQALTGTYRESVYLGLTTSHLVLLPNGAEVSVRNIPRSADLETPKPGGPVRIGWKISDASLHLS